LYAEDPAGAEGLLRRKTGEISCGGPDSSFVGGRFTASNGKDGPLVLKKN